MDVPLKASTTTMRQIYDVMSCHAGVSVVTLPEPAETRQIPHLEFSLSHQHLAQ